DEKAEPRTRTHPSEQDRARFQNLSDEAKAKFIEKMMEAREKLVNASPEEQAAYREKVFAKIESENRTAPVAVKAKGQLHTTDEYKLLSQNYRITISGKEADKALGVLTGLTCTGAISLDGTLGNAETATFINVSGNFEDDHGLIIFSYRIGF